MQMSPTIEGPTKKVTENCPEATWTLPELGVAVGVQVVVLDLRVAFGSVGDV